MSWERVSVADIVTSLNNRRIPLNKEQRRAKEKNGVYPYVGANNIQGYIDEYIFDEKILCLAEDGGSWGYNQNCAVIIDEKCWVNNHAHVLISNGRVVLEYLKYYFNYADLSLYINGATRGKLTKASLNSIKIPLPPLAEQKQIAEILDLADSVRQKNKQLIEHYNQLSQSLFLDMFGDPVTNPKGWDIVQLGGVCNIQGGFSFKSSKYVDDGIKLVKITNVHHEHLDWSNVERLPYDFMQKYPDFLLAEGDILMALTRPIIKSLGAVKAITVRSEDLPALLNQRVARFKPNENFLNKEYLLEFIYSNFFKDKISQYTSTSLQPNISNFQVKSIEIMLPPLVEQECFSTYIKLLRAQKRQAEESLKKSEDLFNSLLQKAFKGELSRGD